MSSTSYEEAESQQIKAQWLQDKARIDANPAFRYYRDRDKEDDLNDLEEIELQIENVVTALSMEA